MRTINLPKSFNYSKANIAIVIITTIFVCLYCGRWVYYQKGEEAEFTTLIQTPSSMQYARDIYSKTRRTLPEKDSIYSVEVNGIKINRLSEADRDVLCFDYDLPCSADYVGGLEMRGPTLQEGFKCNPDAPHRLTY